MGKIGNYFKYLFHSQKLRVNLIIFIFIMFACVTFPSILLLIHYNSQYSLQEIKRLSAHTLDLSCSNFTQTLLGTKKISTSLLSNNTLQTFLNNNVHSPNDIIALENTLYNLCSTSPNDISAYLYDKNSECHFTDSGRKKELLSYRFEELKIYSLLLEADGKSLCLNSKDIYKNTSGISVCRIINDLETLKPKGILVLNIPLESLIQSFSPTDSSNQFSFVYDTQENPVFSSLPGGMNIIKSINLKGETNNTTSFKIEKQTYIVSYSCLDEYPFIVGIVRNIDDFGLSFLTNATLIFFLLAVNLIILSAGIYIIAHAVTSPISSLSEEMMAIQRDGFRKIDTYFEPTNEIGYLVFCYNKMINEIQALLQKEIDAEKHKRHLELNLLQAQIKPHFLYNTLDTARALSLSNEPKEVNRLLKALGCYYQLTLSKGKSIVTIQNEINSIRQYETILKYANSSEFTIHYDIDETVYTLPILKFILQPLVENCIKHGLYGCEDGNITIQILFQEDTMSIKVTDDGIGMDAVLVNSLLSSNDSKIKSSFGLLSTMERMALQYGSDCENSIISQLHYGTTISFRIKNFMSHIPTNWEDFKENHETNIKIINCR